MLQQLLNNLFYPEKRKVMLILSEIDRLYLFINRRSQLYGDRHFQKMFPKKYWNYLQQYTWLNKTQQDKLITGCLNIILFSAHDCIRGTGTVIEKHFKEILNAVNSFQPETDEQTKLWFMVKEALILCEKKMNLIQDNNKENSIYQSITWTLKHTVLNKNPS